MVYIVGESLKLGMDIEATQDDYYYIRKCFFNVIYLE